MKDTQNKKYILTDEHRSHLQPWAYKWIENAINMEVKRFGFVLDNFMALKVP
jgi:hypothetical protein